MKEMHIYEPAMCCPTGLCGVGVDPELLRISTVLENLKKNGVTVERYNLATAPQMFSDNVAISNLLMAEGVEALPVTVVDGEIVLTKRYPDNNELAALLEVPLSYVGIEEPKEDTGGESGCCCGGPGDSSCCC